VVVPTTHLLAELLTTFHPFAAKVFPTSNPPPVTGFIGAWAKLPQMQQKLLNNNK
jgi:hypothetical protein